MPLESSISRMPQGLYELSLNGQLHRPHWVVQLFTALSELRVSIQSGHAAQDRMSNWKSLFVLDFSQSTADPQGLNYAAFAAQTASSARTAAPRLTHFDLLRRADRLLEIKLEGPDQIGFMASLLSRVSLLCLFPSSLEIDTNNGQIRDCIVLRGISNQGPSDAAYRTLEQMLRSFLIK